MDASQLAAERLVERLLVRDPDALAQLYDAYSGAVYGLALRILGDPSGAEDVTHDVVLKLWVQADQYRPERGSLRAWLLSITHNRAIDLLRRQRVAEQRRSTPDLERARLQTATLSDPGDDAARADEAVRVRWALEQLPLAQRNAIEMAFFQGKTHVEISAELGEPLGTAKTRIRLGMRKLRALLDGKGTVLEAE